MCMRRAGMDTGFAVPALPVTAWPVEVEKWLHTIKVLPSE